MDFINTCIEGLTAFHCKSLSEVPSDLCDLLVADHPHIGEATGKIKDFAEQHPEIPVIMTKLLGFPLI